MATTHVRRPHPEALFSILPCNNLAQAIVASPHNRLRVCEVDTITGEPRQGIDIGFHIRSTRTPFTLATIGRDGDIRVSDHKSFVSSIQCSFELNTSSLEISLRDSSSTRNTQIRGSSATAFEKHRSTRSVLVAENTNTHFGFGGDDHSRYLFEIVWHRKAASLNKSLMPHAVQRAIKVGTTISKPELPIRYVKRACLGHGGYGSVYDAVNVDTADNFAVKRISPWLSESRFEADLLSRMSHENIIDLVADQRAADGCLEIFMPKMKGSVTDLIATKSFEKDTDVETFLFHTWSALDYLNRIGYVHQDVKPDNILYTVRPDGKFLFKLADFGVSDYSSESTLSVVGTSMFLAPEMLRRRTGPRTHKVDIWALYVTLVCIIRGQTFTENLFSSSKTKRFRMIKDASLDQRARRGILYNLRAMACHGHRARISAGTLLECFMNGKGRSTLLDTKAATAFLARWKKAHGSWTPSIFNPAV